MLRSITARQLQEWMTFSELEPFGEERGDYRAASIVQVIANVNRDSKKHPDAFPIADFLLRFGDSVLPKAKQKDWKQLKAAAMYIAEAYKEL
jgi:hypothetical protein